MAIKKVAKKAAAKKIVLKDNTLYVLSVRNKFFFWTPHSVYETRPEAEAVRAVYESDNVLAIEAAKITPVKLVRPQ